MSIDTMNSPETSLQPPAHNVQVPAEDNVAHRLAAFQANRQDAQYAETITQSRLYNFLVADSLLLLAWAAVFASTAPIWIIRTAALIVLALTSAVLALSYKHLGSRGSKFVRMHYDQLAAREAQVPPELRFSAPLTEPQRTGEYTLLFPRPGEEREIRLSPEEREVGRTHLTVEVPGYLQATSLVFLFLSIADAGLQVLLKADVIRAEWLKWLK